MGTSIPLIFSTKLGKRDLFCPFWKRLELAKTRASCTLPGHPTYISVNSPLLSTTPCMRTEWKGQVEKREPGCENGNGNEPGSGPLTGSAPGSVLFYFLFLLLALFLLPIFFYFLFFFFKHQPTKSLLKAEFWLATVVCSVWEAPSLDETLSDV